MCKGKRQMKFWNLTLTAIVLIISSNANAALVSRLGGLAVYDTDLDITWLADTQAAAGTVFDVNDGSGFDDGYLTWEQANAWTASLIVGGRSGWRLPTTFTVDSSCTGDAAGTAPSAYSEGYNCSGSELGHLFYNELSGIAGNTIRASTDSDLALFSIDQPALVFWSGTEYGAQNAWWFRFGDGQQSISTKEAHYNVWAVLDGDVSAVPIPAAVWLFGSGFIGLVGFARRKKA